MSLAAPRSLLGALALAAFGVGGCNVLTGADGLHVVGEGGADPGTDPLTPAGATIAKISFTQGVDRVLEQNGAPKISNLPLVAHRRGLLRVFVAADARAIGTEVSAKLTFGGKVFEQTKTIRASSTEADLESTFNFRIPASMLHGPVAFRVELGGDAVVSPLGRYPVDVDEKDVLSVPRSEPNQLKVVLVPIEYAFGGASNTAVLTGAKIKTIREAFEAMYPIAKVHVTTRSTWRYDEAAVLASAPPKNDGSAGDDGWAGLLNAFTDVRRIDGGDFDSYYFGVIEPAKTAAEYCPIGCVTGLGWIVDDAATASDRAAVGVGYEPFVGHVAPHEVAHLHGRKHTSCGTDPSTVDENYPSDKAHAGGAIGVPGFDFRSGSLVPANTLDFMGYCDPFWVSDYTYGALHDRILELPDAEDEAGYDAAEATYSRAWLRPDGSLVPLEPVTLRYPGRMDHRVEMEMPGGTEIGLAHFSEYDHAKGGVLTWRAPAQPATRVRVTVGDRLLSLKR